MNPFIEPGTLGNGTVLQKKDGPDNTEPSRQSESIAAVLPHPKAALPPKMFCKHAIEEKYAGSSTVLLLASRPKLPPPVRGVAGGASTDPCDTPFSGLLHLGALPAGKKEGVRINADDLKKSKRHFAYKQTAETVFCFGNR